MHLGVRLCHLQSLIPHQHAVIRLWMPVVCASAILLCFTSSNNPLYKVLNTTFDLLPLVDRLPISPVLIQGNFNIQQFLPSHAPSISPSLSAPSPPIFPPLLSHFRRGGERAERIPFSLCLMCHGAKNCKALSLHTSAYVSKRQQASLREEVRGLEPTTGLCVSICNFGPVTPVN